MPELTRRHPALLQQRMGEQGIDLAVLADEDTSACFGGFWGYLGVEDARGWEDGGADHWGHVPWCDLLRQFPRELSIVDV